MIVYLATNTLNGKRYIGATKGTLKERRRRHRWEAKNRPYCRVFHAALRKYGEAAFYQTTKGMRFAYVSARV